MQEKQCNTTARIKKISKFFRLMFQFAFIVQPIMLVIFWSHLPFRNLIALPEIGFSMNFIPPETYILHPLSDTTRLYAFLVSLIPVGISEIMLLYLIKLFYLYEKAEIFSPQSVKYLRYIGYALLMRQLIHPFYQAAITAILTWGNGHGARYAIASFTGSNITGILIAFLIILISWIMAEGYKLQEEHDYTV